MNSKTCAERPALDATESFTTKACKKLLLSALSGLNRGRLEMRLPDGNMMTFGLEPESKFQATVNVHSSQMWKKCVLYGHIGFAEAFMDGDWDSPDLKAVITWFVLNIENSTVLEGHGNKSAGINLLGALNRVLHTLRPNDNAGSRKNIQEHYDLSNDFFKLFLDDTMTYSSARFSNEEQSLQAAQIDKIDTLCRKLKLQPTDELLEIGSGWGAFSIHAVRNYGCKVHTVTISQAQYDLAAHRIEEAGLSDRIKISICDYRKIEGIYDKVVSVEMIEAVGDRFMNTFAATCSKLLKPNGILALQMITCPDSRYELLRDNVDFIQKYIFPGSLLPSVGRVTRAFNETSTLSLFELEDMGLSYMRTLDEWYQRFNSRLPEVQALGFDDRFIRKWNYYLQYCSAAFSMRNISVVQAVFTRPNNLNI
jgi:cyclopropane-fatty-acyl-phospholipid synthase